MRKEIIEYLKEEIPQLKSLKGKKVIEIRLSKTSTSQSSNFLSMFRVDKVLSKGTWISVSETYNMNFALANMSSAENAHPTTENINRYNPLQITIDFDTDSGKFFFIGLLLRPEIDCGVFPKLVPPIPYLFELAIPDLENSILEEKINAKNKAINNILNYSVNRLHDLIYFLRKSPFSNNGTNLMGKTQAIVALIGENFNGWAMGNLDAYNKFHEMSNTPEQALQLLFYKGIHFKFISLKNGIYVFNETDAMGSSEIHCLEYLNKNRPVVSMLAEKISMVENGKMDNYVDILLSNPQEKRVSATVNLKEADEETRLAEIKILVEKGWTVKKIAEETKLSSTMCHKYITMVKEQKASLGENDEAQIEQEDEE